MDDLSKLPPLGDLQKRVIARLAHLMVSKRWGRFETKLQEGIPVLVVVEDQTKPERLRRASDEELVTVLGIGVELPEREEAIR